MKFLEGIVLLILFLSLSACSNLVNLSENENANIAPPLSSKYLADLNEIRKPANSNDISDEDIGGLNEIEKRKLLNFINKDSIVKVKQTIVAPGGSGCWINKIIFKNGKASYEQLEGFEIKSGREFVVYSTPVFNQNTPKMYYDIILKDKNEYYLLNALFVSGLGEKFHIPRCFNYYFEFQK
jgi:hypothetical protein